MSVSAIKSTPAAPPTTAASLKPKKKGHSGKVPTAAQSAPATSVKPSGAAASNGTSNSTSSSRINVRA